MKTGQKGGDLRVQSRKRYENDLLAGRFSALKAFSSEAAAKSGVLDLAILAHGLTGDLQAALWHFDYIAQKGIHLSEDNWSAIHFAIGVGRVRISEYSLAKKSFALLGAYRHGGARARFYLYQGLGFFHFFTGHFEKSRAHAEMARRLAVQNGFGFGQMLAEELFALSSIEDGRIRVGLKHLKIAIQLARLAGNKSWEASFKLHLLLNEAQHGIGSDSLQRLDRALKFLRPEDTHSRNSVKLELANQLILRGKAEAAKKVLDEACDSIYASRNRRHIALLNFRLAFLIFLRGSADDAVHLLRSAELNLHPNVDRVWSKKMRGLRLRIEGQKDSGRWHSAAAYGEDPLGDLYQAVIRKKPEALQSVLELGYFHLLLRYFDLPPHAQILALDLIPRGFIRIDRGNVAVVSRAFSNTLRKVLQVLANGHVSKEELTRLVWGYDYNPERHDPLIYTTISKIRSWLGPCADWIESDSSGYRLRSNVQVVVHGNALEKVGSSRLVEWGHGQRWSPNLNIRCFRIMAIVNSTTGQRAIDVRLVMQEFRVSRATATRDLNQLVKRGLLRKMGLARATFYVKGDQ